MINPHKKHKNDKNLLFFVVFFTTIFIVTFVFLYIFGLVPKEIDQSEKEGVLDVLRRNTIENASYIDNILSGENDHVVIDYKSNEEPKKLSIPSIGLEVSVENPESKSVAVLDEYLKKGVVRYEDSGLLGSGNMLLFGHSGGGVNSSPAYKFFNNIKNLKKDDVVYIDSDNYRYVYKVSNVSLVNANTALVDFGRKENMVTLSTCNTFGAKQERHVVEALFINRISL